MRQPKIAPKRNTIVHFSIVRFANNKYGRFPFHRHAAFEMPFKRSANAVRTSKFNFQE